MAQTILTQWMKTQIDNFKIRLNSRFSDISYLNVNIEFIDTINMPPKKSKAVVIGSTSNSQEVVNREKKELIRQFEIMIYKVNSDNDKNAVFRVKQYVDIIKILDNYPKPLVSDLEDIKKWIIDSGKKNPAKILVKINEFIQKGYFDEAKEAMENPRVKSVMNLTKIYGVGPAKAKELYEEYNIVTVEELVELVRQNKFVLNDKQRIGIEYFYDLQERIPRSEMDEYYSIVLDVCKKISPEIKMSINGSYRRGLVTSGDIDVLITSNDGKSETYRKKIRDALIKIGVIREVLADGNKKFMGITKLSDSHKARHLDLMNTDSETFPFAQLYFTGSGSFNAMMRHNALELGYTLNEYSLRDKITKSPIKNEVILSKIGKDVFETEMDIFKFLDMDYVEPENRETYGS